MLSIALPLVAPLGTRLLRLLSAYWMHLLVAVLVVGFVVWLGSLRAANASMRAELAQGEALAQELAASVEREREARERAESALARYQAGSLAAVERAADTRQRIVAGPQAASVREWGARRLPDAVLHGLREADADGDE